MPRRCPLCHKKPTDEFYGLLGYSYCSACRLGWVKKAPKAKYDESYYKGKSSVGAKIFSPISYIFYTIRSFYTGSGKRNAWLDVGAGEGGYLRTVNAEKKIGVEVSSSGRKMMEKQGFKTLTDQEFLKTKNLDADVISFWHVLEHVKEPSEYLLSAKRNLIKNGKIIIGVPNIDSLEFNLARKYWFHLQPRFHLWYFTTESLKILLKRAGFKIGKIDYWSIEHHLTGVLQSFINKVARSEENVLHKLIKRGTGEVPLKRKDVFWSFFFFTIGAPIIFLFWITGSILKKSGTIVLVAERS